MTDPKKVVVNRPLSPSGKLTRPVGLSALKRGRRRLVLSFLIVFALPSFLGTFYYTVMAADRYAAGASFVVRGLDAGGSSDIVSSFTGLTSTGSTTSDSYIIRRYLLSPDIVRVLQAQVGLIDHYSGPLVDRWGRFDSADSFEDFVEYWSHRVTTSYDSTTGIVSFEIQAFDPETALQLAEIVLAETRTLINNLSEQARRDSVQFATSEVVRAESRLLAAQLALSDFRSAGGSVDPTLNAQFNAELVATLETRLADLNAEIQVLSSSIDADSPTMRLKKREVAALEAQIQQRRSAIGANNPSSGSLTTADALAKFEGLQIEQTFAQQRYASALSSLENARADADRQQRYLAVFAEPYLPDEAAYPYRMRNVLLLFAGFFALWAIATLIVYAVRDHMR